MTPAPKPRARTARTAPVMREGAPKPATAEPVDQLQAFGLLTGLKRPTAGEISAVLDRVGDRRIAAMVLTGVDGYWRQVDDDAAKRRAARARQSQLVLPFGELAR